MILLSYAIQMEMDGEQYYLRQAELHADEAIANAFRLIGKAEHRHAELLRGLAEGRAEDLDPDELSADTASIFSSLDDFRRDASRVATQLEAYREAEVIEELSIRLYERMLETAGDDRTRRLLAFLADQERQHRELFLTLGEMVRKPEQYVVDSQFTDPAHMNRSMDEEKYQ